MSDPTRHLLKYLRIVWSVTWSVVAVLLLVQWVQSFQGRYSQEILVTPAYRYYLQSFHGSLTLGWEQRVFLGIEFFLQHDLEDFERQATNTGFKIVRDGPNGAISAISVSYWLLVLADILMGAGPRFSPRFTLRTLLLCTTLVAVVLGLIFQQSY